MLIHMVEYVGKKNGLYRIQNMRSEKLRDLLYSELITCTM